MLTIRDQGGWGWGWVGGGRGFQPNVSKGKGLAGGWKILLEKLRWLGVSPKVEPRWEEMRG